MVVGTYSANSPEEVSVHVLVDLLDLAVGRHNFDLDDVVDGETTARRQDRVATTGDVATGTDRFAVAANRNLSVLVERPVQIPRNGPGAKAGSVALQRAARGKPELVRMVHNVADAMHPDRQSTWGIGATQEIMAGGLDNQAYIVAASFA